MERALEQALRTKNIRLRSEWGSTFYHRDDLPFSSIKEGLPAVFSQFRKIVETKCTVRNVLPTPKSLPPLPSSSFVQDFQQRISNNITSTNVNEGSLFSVDLEAWKRYCDSTITVDARGIVLSGGETSALARLHYYLFESNHISTYKDTRNGLIGLDYTSKFSA